MNVFIKGVASVFPPRVRRNEEWPAEFVERLSQKGDRLFNDIPRATDRAAEVTDKYLAAEARDPFLGVIERRVADDDASSAEAEAAAAESALEDAGIGADAIDAVISYSVTPDRLTPASATRVAARLGIEGALAFGMDAACATAILQLQTAAALVESGQAEHVLLTQSHLLLRSFPMLHPAAPGLGDGATACVVSRTGRYRLVAVHAVTHGEYYDAVTWVRGDGESEDTGWWKAGADFRVGTKDRDGAKVLQRDTVSFAARTLREVFTKAEIDVERLGLLCSVEPRGWVPGATLEVLGLRPELASSVYPYRAHLGAVGPIANLHSADVAGRCKGDGYIALYGQGAGFTRAAAVLEMDASG